MQNDLQSIYRYRLNNSTAQGQRDVAPVIVKEMTRKVFKSKTKLAKSGIFVSEALTKCRRDILYTAKGCFNLQVMALCETFLIQDSPLSSFSFSSYQLTTKSRASMSRGGLGLIVSDSLQ